MTRHNESREGENLAGEISQGIRRFSTNQAVIGCATILATIATIVGFFISGWQVGINTNSSLQMLPLEETVHVVQTVTAAVSTAIHLGIIPSPGPDFDPYGTATAIIQNATQNARYNNLDSPFNPDNIRRTATAIVRKAATDNFIAQADLEGISDVIFTATALINQQATQDIIRTAKARGVDEISLTATAIIQQATEVASFSIDTFQLTAQTSLQILGEDAVDIVAAGTVNAKINEQIVTAAFAQQTQSVVTEIAQTRQFETAIAKAVETQISQLTAVIPTNTFVPVANQQEATSENIFLTATSIIRSATQRAATLSADTQVQTEQPVQSIWLPLFAVMSATLSLIGIFTLIVRNRRS